ncbi:KilA-N domain-containing protein [Pontibacter sp. G13]|uniref:KilA-N domain-containing protein n=1 Tax=Pontibacter sp. G13 TaxID=3074898 RepID=UPI0028899D62|nr:KilA-N domain-containing protein [Pontibacter sp. G13]WNJ21600.1 KilA-N domain-containing protein [Pontibacter sp. G13]
MKPKKSQVIQVSGLDVSIREIRSEDYISLTDMAKSRNNQTTDTVIQAWLKRGNTLKFIELWEGENNPDFNPLQMQGIRMELSEEANYISAKQLIERAGIISIESRRGRYGGTYAHRDIAFEFATWLSPEFKYYLIKEFDRLKREEAKRLEQQWDHRRFLSKVNYRLHTSTIQEVLIPAIQAPKNKEWIIYADEADLLNMAVFGTTARQWRESNPELAKQGNMRDHADIFQLNVLANLESLNSFLIEEGRPKEDRFEMLTRAALSQYRRLAHDENLKKLEE